jgi:predicted ATPase/DNA-binding SARP family transcriptional activator
MGGVEFRLLGPIEVLIEGEASPGLVAGERELLALLLLSPGRPVQASSLIDRLWADGTLPVDPVNALHLRVSRLRRALTKAGVDVVRRVGTAYVIDVDRARVDVERFVHHVRAARTTVSGAVDRASIEALRSYDQALTLWRGEPFAEFVADKSWAAVESARLRQLHLAALTERGQVALALGRNAEVVTDLDPVVADDPTQEPLAEILMTALYRHGRQAEALEVYARTRSVLDEELGLEPSAALRTLHQRILRQDPELLPAGRRGTGVEAAALPSGQRDHDPGSSDGVPAGAGQSRGGGPAAGQPGTGVPVLVRPLIGREGELSALADLLGRSRLVTLVGAGGAGKTSLAVAVVPTIAAAFPDGVCLVRLAPVSEPAHVPLAIADALGVPLDGSAPTVQVVHRLVSYLARRRLLLVLDNCEHVVDAAARAVDEILARCPQVSVLATSREALAVPGEIQVVVAPLTPPPEGAPPGWVLDFPAARLFVERARAVRGDLELSEEDLVAVARICQRLDGMPLALELAAARVSSLSVRDVADRLDHRFALLTAGPRTAEARQRTLRATVDWSHNLLAADEQLVLRRLAVFRGGWSLAAATAVVSDATVPQHEVLDVLSRLVHRSLVIADAGHPTRYRMLETLREYADERLVESGERELVAGRHAAFFVGLAEDAAELLRGHGQREGLRRLREEQANLRAALGWLTSAPERSEEALRLAGALGLFWHLGRHVEGREVLSRVVATARGSRTARARALQAVSMVERPRGCLVHPSPRCAETARESLELFTAEGDLHRAALSRVLLAVEGVTGAADVDSERLLREAEEQFTASGDPWGHAVIAFVRLETYIKTGDEVRAVATGRAAASAFRGLDDPWGLSAVLYHLGWGLRQFGRYVEAVPVLEEAIDVANSAGLYNTAQWALADLGVALLHLNHLDEASASFERARTAGQDIGDGAGEVLAAYGHGLMARLTGDWPRARELFTKALVGFQDLRTPAAAGLALAGLARCDEADGLADTARDRYEQVHDLGEAVGEPALRASGLEGLARLAASQGENDKAGELLTLASDIRSRGSRPAPPHERADLPPLAAVT